MPNPSPELPELASARGEMVDRVRAFDWAATPLGPMARWPASLRMAVGICLSSRFPMFVWWGPELVNIYNDAYIPILGNKHPQALGRPAQPTWQEIWHVVGPQAEAVMQRGEATWNQDVLLVMQRHGFVEDTYFTWSYSPIFDERGRIAGVFCACTEETARVLAERDRDGLIRQLDTERSRLASAFEQSPSFLALMRGPDHVFEFANERYYELIGRVDIVGRSVREVLPEVADQGFFDILDTVYRTGETYVGSGVRLGLRRGPGAPIESIFVDFVYQPRRDAQGQVEGVLAQGVDVTARHQAEIRDRFLLRLDEELRALASPREITLAGARLLAEHLEADRCAYADVEADQDTFNLEGDYNRGVPSIVGRYRFADFGAEVLRLMREGRPYVVSDIETHRPAPESLEAYRRTSIRAVVCVPLLKSGRFVAAMAVHQSEPRAWTEPEVALVQHVASRCYESIERARVERTLRESESNFRQLADAMPQMVFVADTTGAIVYLNRQWYEYTGQPPGEASPRCWESTLAPEDLRRVEYAWPRSLASGEPFEMEYPIRRHDGARRWHLVRAVPVRDSGGRIVRWFGTNTDIHDRKQMEQALHDALQSEHSARAEAEMASRMKDEFLATLSHELRTPLNAILGWAHLLRREGGSAKDVARGAEVIERNARAQSRIIEDLLDMSAIISGKVHLDLQRVDFATLVRAAVDTARPTAAAKEVRLEARIDPAVPQAAGDPHRLQQVLWNLLSNAVKFTPPGGEVRVALEVADGAIRITVADTGSGIPTDFLPHVFDRFRQADASSTRTHGGLGLGLAIVKQLVEMHAGTVTAASPGRGRGATFTVQLPLAGGPPAAQASLARTLDIPAAERALMAGLRLLVVDDEADARELVKRLLEECGAEVATAGSSAEALALLREHRFDLLVSDIGMPGEDGHALIRKVRSLDGRRGEIPAVALTAYARPEDRVKAIRSGFQIHAAKPVEPAELVAIVASLARR